MEVIGFVILIFIIWSYVSNSKEETKRKENERINERIKKGESVRLTNGEVVSSYSITHYEKKMLPDYQYLSEYGEKYGYNYHYMSVQELKAAAKVVRYKLAKEAEERKRIEAERRIIEIEQRKIEKERLREEAIRMGREEKWKRLLAQNLFNIDKSSQDSRKRGIYVIHCVPDNRLYIGSSKNMLTRKSQHLNALRKRKHHSFLLQEAFDELGESNFNFYVIKLVTKDDLFLASQYEDEKEIEIALKREIKSIEQSYLNSYSPTFNIEDDASGRRHWEGKLKYRSGYRNY